MVSSALRVLTFKVIFFYNLDMNDDDNDDDKDDDDGDDDDPHQVLNIRVHHGKPCALRVVAILKETNCHHHYLDLIKITLAG